MKTVVKNILLVNNSVNDVTLIKAAFQDAHLCNTIFVVDNGEEALDFLYKRGNFANYTGEEPIFILLDIKMPSMNGIDVLKFIRADAAFNKIPVIMLSSSRDSRDLQECYDNGANSFIVKPVNVNEFMSAVKDLGQYWVAVNELPE